jgi:hypothetical protein
MILNYAILGGTRCFEWVCNSVSRDEGKCILRLFEERVLMKIFGIKKDTITAFAWRAE